MPFRTGLFIVKIATVALPILISAVAAESAMDPRFDLDSQALGAIQPAAKTSHKNDKHHTAAQPAKTGTDTGKGTPYTVKAGDHLFKILMRDYGLTNDEAESFIEEIRRENNIYDIKRLKIGQRIIIPPVRRRADGSLKLVQPAVSARKLAGGDAGASQAFRLDSPVEPVSEQQALGMVRDTWDKIVPGKPDVQKPLYIQNATFSLTLDPQRYPMFATMGNGRILLDNGSSIPPLVRSLIEEKDPSIKIVTESPAPGNRFLGAMLESAGFYSLEENFSMNFGTDPKLTIHADYKIEKTPDSLIKQDVSLVNGHRDAMPPVLADFLKKEGFSVYEPFASLRPFLGNVSRQLYSINAKKQPDIVDSVLGAFALPVEHDRRLDVFAAENNGITLSVKAERYFERSGQRYIVTKFDGDPVTYTLFRLLETKGYRVVILEGQDDFRKITEKILTRMKIKGNYAQHNMTPAAGKGYEVQISGFRLEDTSLPGGQLFLTNIEMDKVVRDLLTESGYSIKGK